MPIIVLGAGNSVEKGKILNKEIYSKYNFRCWGLFKLRREQGRRKVYFSYKGLSAVSFEIIHEKQETCQEKIWEEAIHIKAVFFKLQTLLYLWTMKLITWGGTTSGKILENITWNNTFVSVIHIFQHVYVYTHIYVWCTPTRVTMLIVFLTLVMSKNLKATEIGGPASVKALRARKSFVSCGGKGGQLSRSEHWGGMVWNEVGNICNFPTLNLQPAP